MASSEVNQSGATAGGDVIGGDKVIHNHHPASQKLSKLDELKKQLELEIQSGKTSCDEIEQLTHYKKPIAHDGVVGLEAKLNTANRSAQYRFALESKERFAKLMEKWSLYASAQEILVYLLARAENRFTLQIAPQIAALSPVAIDELIEEKIVTPTVEDVGVSPVSFDHGTAMGMVYWLAEQCRVKWHQ